MKRLIQISLLLWLVSSATAQDRTAQPWQKTLRVYDWKDLACSRISGGEIISMDGISVLKIENTNNAPLEVSLLKFHQFSLINRRILFHVK